CRETAGSIEPNGRVVQAAMTGRESAAADVALKIDGLAPTRGVLDNGVTLLTKQTRTTPAVTIHASLAGGSAVDPAELSGGAHFVSRTIDRGTAQYSADALAEQLDSRGVSLSVLIGRHALSLVCTCLVEDFEAILSLVGEILISPTFPADEVERRRGEHVG